MINNDLDKFLMRGLFASLCIRDFQASGALRSRETESGINGLNDMFVSASEEIRNSSLQMQRSFRVLYVLENLVREFINATMVEAYDENWFAKKVPRKMKDKLDKRIAEEQRNKWHVGRNQDPLFYMDFGDLALIITNEWEKFADFFPSQVWVTSRIEDSERSRNVIAHTNVLSAEEALRLEMHLRDWIKQIG